MKNKTIVIMVLNSFAAEVQGFIETNSAYSPISTDINKAYSFKNITEAKVLASELHLSQRVKSYLFNVCVVYGL